MLKNTRTGLAITAIVLISVLVFFFGVHQPPDESNDKEASKLKDGFHIFPRNRSNEQFPKPSGLDLVEKEIEHDVDWDLCVDKLDSPDCIAELTKVIDDITVVGDLSWVDLIERLDQNTNVVNLSLDLVECSPVGNGWSPIENFKRPNPKNGDVKNITAEVCAAAFAEVGALVAVCADTQKTRTSPLYSKGAVDYAEQAGISDLSQLRAFEQQDRYRLLEKVWLRNKCPSLRQAISQMPGLYFQVDRKPSNDYPAHSSFSENYPLREIKLAAAYIERAVLLGDYRVADRYVRAIRDTAYLRVDSISSGSPFEATWLIEDKHREEAVRRFEARIESVINQIIETDPLLGHQAMADHLVLRYPGYRQYSPSKKNLDFVEWHNGSPLVQREKDFIYLPKDDWYKRSLDLATHQLVANRLQGVDESLMYSPYGGRAFNAVTDSVFETILDPNDWEFASQRANALIKEIQGR